MAALCLVAMAPGARSDDALPFAISVDGQKIDGSGPALGQAATDKALQSADIQVKFDGLGAKPVLNVSTVPIRVTYRAGEELKFLASDNYSAFIARREIRIYRRGDFAADEPFEVLEVSAMGAASWIMPADGPAEMDYVLRVYDAKGRFNETRPLPLAHTAKEFVPHVPSGEAAAPGYGEDRTLVRNIDVWGGAVTVYGRNVPEGHSVNVFGNPVPVDNENSFVVQSILPPGMHTVHVAVTRNGEGLEFDREIDIPKNEWFYVALADLTAGYNFGGKNIEDVKPGEFDETFTRGRAAFYLKGKIKGRYLLTAAADTGEDSITDVFDDLDGKDPRQFLARLDPDDYYPVYGDDSTGINDAPTRGKFYVRVDRGPSHVMWGYFRSNITGAKFLRSERALYGAGGAYRSDTVTSNGEAKTSLDAHAAQPGTLPQRESFRGTGGSAYFLSFQDITPGSETISIEVRNEVTGWIVERRVLQDGTDYTIDYLQGMLILKKPVPSSSFPGTANFVVANYEYTPVASNVNGYVLGGRAQQWVGEHLRIGTTGMVEKTGAADQKLYGADVRLQSSQKTYVELEYGHSEGPGFGSSYSPDGGLTVQDNASAGAGQKADAYAAELRADLGELTGGRMKGTAGARYQSYGEGFSSLDYEADDAKETWGAYATADVTDNVTVAMDYAEQENDDGGHEYDGRASVKVDLDEHWSLLPNGRVSREDGNGAPGTQTGDRADAGVKIAYAWDEDTEAYVLAQATLNHTGTREADNRAGFGGKRRLTEKVNLAGEVSYGTQGPAALAALEYEPAADDRYYLGYRLDSDRDNATNWPFTLVGDDLGTVVGGVRRRLSEDLIIYGEDNFDIFGERQSLTQTYGVTYTPDARWTIGGGLEVGQVYDNTIDPATGLQNTDFDRKALSLTAVYRGENGIDGKARGEVRHDNPEDGSSPIDSFFLGLGLGIKVSDDWRALGAIDAVMTGDTDTTREGKYVEGSIGFAYRPADNDRLNALVKLTYLYDIPGPDQVGIDGTTDSPAQQSLIFSADAMYDLNEFLTLGAKYGFRLGETKDRDQPSDWEDDNAHLAVLRTDFHIVHEWDAMLEGRVLWTPTSDTADLGLVAAIYRQIGDNMKLGVGYNFGSFSDDLRDLVADDGGVFVNLIGKL